jgi:protocatechuate 3,4-dioxygenase beta subunit
MVHPRLARRRVLATSLAGAAGLACPVAMRAVAALLPTPQQTAGPFYPESFPADSDSDLVHVAGRGERARGVLTQLSGRILDRDGRPLTGARVEIWQCDANGRYHHVRDGRTDQPRDENFQGFGQTATDASGSYRFLTIRPVPYPGRTPHIHFAVSAQGVPRLVTQMYVAGEPDNERDALLLGIRDPAARARVIVPLQPMLRDGAPAFIAEFDIVIGVAAG